MDEVTDATSYSLRLGMLAFRAFKSRKHPQQEITYVPSVK
jgi:hypothetical protein